MDESQSLLIRRENLSKSVKDRSERCKMIPMVGCMDQFIAIQMWKNYKKRRKTFIETMKEALGFRAKGRKIICTDDTFELREVIAPYGKANDQNSGNTYLWKQ